MGAGLLQSTISTLPLFSKGKVRDIYTIDDDYLLIVTSDRISAFDVVFADAIPGKGRVLTALSDFWMKRLQSVVPNHLSELNPANYVSAAEAAQLEGRAIVAKRLQPIRIEAVVRGYLAGSAWLEYQAGNTVCDIALPKGLKQAAKLANPIFTPAAKAPDGEHDYNVNFDYVVQLLGLTLAEQVQQVSVQLYTQAAHYALSKGVIIADTKFEFGLDQQGRLHLIDEALTPDSSRFWPADAYQEGINPPSFDKQYLRDWLETTNWNKQAPAPRLPQEIIEQTAAKYQEALQRLTQ